MRGPAPTPSTPTRLAPGDAAYPALLAVVPMPPALSVRGALADDDALAIAIVGARHATAYGLEVAETLARALAVRGVTVVSGLARGIDTAAHRGALAAGGRTLAVLGSGIDVVYPSENRHLADEITRHGALLSQFAPGEPPRPGHFPVRNRTIAGLALGVVVVEAGERSGALITARFAADFGREVFAVPGRITAETGRGTNRLIREGATLVRDWTDIVDELPEPWRRAIRPTPNAVSEALPSAESEEGRVLALLSADEPQHLDALVARAGRTSAWLAARLLRLEMAGWVRQLEGQRWIASTARGGA